MTNRKTGARLALGAFILAAVGVFFAAGGTHYLSLSELQQRRAELLALGSEHPVALALGFSTMYVFVTAFSLPGAAVMTLVGGAVFGLVEGAVLVSFASTTGATLAFLTSRFLLRDAIQRRFAERMSAINLEIARDGAFYLFMLRLVPAVPFFLVNLLMGLTPMRARTFYWVSQIGMLPGTLVYINAGTQLAGLHSLAGIASPGLLGAFGLLGIFPWLARGLDRGLRARRLYRRWPRPRRFDRNLVVIGAGAAGLVTAYIGATVRAKVTLVEKHRMGGDCLNYGCVPSKALIRSARVLSLARRAPEFGLRTLELGFDFAQVMARVRRVIAAVAPHDSVERYAGMGVDVRQGAARITSPWCVEIDGQPLTTRAIVIAAGAEPLVPPIPGLAEAGFLTSDTVWNLRELPRRLLVLGGGPIGCELTQAFARFGAQVTQVELADRLLLREDPEVSMFVRARLERDGVKVLLGHKAVAVDHDTDGKRLVCEAAGARVTVPFDRILVAVGRRPRTAGYGLEELGIPLTKARTIETNEYLETPFPNIYACGDVAGPYQFTHAAAHQAWYAAVNALFGRFRRFRADYSVMPAVTFTDPEVARVGLNESEAEAQGIVCEVTRYGIDDLDRAIAEEEAQGWVKVLTVPGKDRILGATIVGEQAGELLAEFVLAMRQRIGLNKILGTIHAYPTLAESNRYAAGAWKKAHAPQAALRWLERYHRWQRSGEAAP